MPSGERHGNAHFLRIFWFFAAAFGGRWDSTLRRGLRDAPPRDSGRLPADGAMGEKEHFEAWLSLQKPA
ncbi:MAG: hypothetical protein CW342_06355 [Thermoactinomycetaceae bacterium]|nr:hypothetical protein [Bacillota bacterium]MBO2532504.1 hypothetical protein [Thermoactinomycetaceae bacterium]